VDTKSAGVMPALDVPFPHLSEFFADRVVS
jgi:hypothetical protein